jgi:hypothetical protein
MSTPTQTPTHDEDWEAGQDKGGDKSQGQQPAPPRLFTRATVVRTVDVHVQLPRLYPTFHWAFKLRVMLSGEQQKKRDDWGALPPNKQSTGQKAEYLDELCDLMADYPEGFGDLLTEGGMAPGEKFRQYYNETTDATAKFVLDLIIEGAINLYWASVTPREYFPASEDTVS